MHDRRDYEKPRSAISSWIYASGCLTKPTEEICKHASKPQKSDISAQMSQSSRIRFFRFQKISRIYLTIGDNKILFPNSDTIYEGI